MGNLGRLEVFISEIGKVNPDMPISHISYLMVCCRHMGGITYQDLEQTLGMPFSTIARTAGEALR